MTDEENAIEPQDADVIRLEAERHLAAAEQARQTAATKIAERECPSSKFLRQRAVQIKGGSGSSG